MSGASRRSAPSVAALAAGLMLAAAAAAAAAANPTPAAVAGATVAPQEVRFDAPSAERRWLVRLELRLLPVVEARVNGRARPLQAWSTASRNEFLVRDEDRVWLVDAGQRRLFQMADEVRRQLDRELEVAFAYPVPVRESGLDRPSAPVEIRQPRVEVGTTQLPTTTPLGEAKRSRVGDVVYMPNVDLREYIEVYRVAFDVDGRLVEVFFQPTDVS